jgi:hypothetical protein
MPKMNDQIERLAAAAELPLALGGALEGRSRPNGPMQKRPQAPPPPSPLQLISSQEKRDQVRALADRLLPQPLTASAECAFVAAFLAACGRPLLYNPFPTAQAVLLQLSGCLLVDAEKEPKPGWLYITAEAGEITGMGVVKVAGNGEWFVAVDGRSGPYQRDKRSVAYWLAPGSG